MMMALLVWSLEARRQRRALSTQAAAGVEGGRSLSWAPVEDSFQLGWCSGRQRLQSTEEVAGFCGSCACALISIPSLAKLSGAGVTGGGPARVPVLPTGVTRICPEGSRGGHVPSANEALLLSGL